MIDIQWFSGSASTIRADDSTGEPIWDIVLWYADDTEFSVRQWASKVKKCTRVQVIEDESRAEAPGSAITVKYYRQDATKPSLSQRFNKMALLCIELEVDNDLYTHSKRLGRKPGARMK